MLAIAYFNWPFYVAALLMLAASTAGLGAGGYLAPGSGLIALGCLWFLIGSLGVSHWVYDRSDLYKWSWLSAALTGKNLQHIVLCHSGFDEASEMLKPLFPAATWTVLDHFDAAVMTEASIRRARRRFPPAPATIPANYNIWPIAGGTQNVVLSLLAIHELRTVEERVAWFREAGRCLAPDGSVVLVEHVRDLANFAAFGPGFLHFHSIPSWRISWETAGLIQSRHFRITPFVRVFVLTSK